jgi:hypothetical protein
LIDHDDVAIAPDASQGRGDRDVEIAGRLARSATQHEQRIADGFEAQRFDDGDVQPDLLAGGLLAILGYGQPRATRGHAAAAHLALQAAVLQPQRRGRSLRCMRLQCAAKTQRRQHGQRCAQTPMNAPLLDRRHPLPDGKGRWTLGPQW